MATAAEIATKALASLDRFEEIAASLLAHLDAKKHEDALGEAPDELTEPAAVWRKNPNAWEEMGQLGDLLARQLQFRVEAEPRDAYAVQQDDPATIASWLWSNRDTQADFADEDRQFDLKWACRYLRRFLIQAGASGCDKGVFWEPPLQLGNDPIGFAPPPDELWYFEDEDNDVRADNEENSREKEPDDPDARDLLLKLKQRGNRTESLRAIAREVTREPVGNCPIAMRLLDQLRQGKNRGLWSY